MVVQYLHELYAADLTEIQATSALKEVIPKIQTWAEKYFNWTPKVILILFPFFFSPFLISII